MNYLAHLRLSPDDAESMTGNLMGDFRKYLHGTPLPERVMLGIDNHVRVDRFTDTSPLVRGLKRHVSKKRRRFAGIIIDVAFDHFLARRWKAFNEEDLDVFVSRVHGQLLSKREIMPAAMQSMLGAMIRNEWLRSYRHMDGIARALDGISSRIRFENRLAGAAEEIRAKHTEMEQGFLEFFPALLGHVERGG